MGEQKEIFNDEHKELPKKLQIPKKYYEMIEDMSYSKDRGYYIHLKEAI